jgi:hypothetical protein
MVLVMIVLESAALIHGVAEHVADQAAGVVALKQIRLWATDPHQHVAVNEKRIACVPFKRSWLS